MAENAEDLVILQEIEFKDEELTAAEAEHAAIAAPEGFEDDIAFAQEMEACWSFGPLRVCASVVPGGVQVTASLLGRTILTGTLSTSRPRLCVSPNFFVAKASVCIVLEVSQRQVRVEGELCVRKLFGGWSCARFNVRLLSW
jgi:hypothetical protein